MNFEIDRRMVELEIRNLSEGEGLLNGFEDKIVRIDRGQIIMDILLELLNNDWDL